MLNHSIRTYVWGLFSFQGLIVCEIRTTVRIRWSFVQMCCAMSLVSTSIATHRICQFWAHSEPINMRAVIQFLYSEQAMRNVVLRYCPSSWQYSAAYCSCNKEAPPGLDSLWFSSLSSYETVIGGQLAQWAADQCRELAESTGGWLLWWGYWKLGTMLWKMSMSEHRLCREVAGRWG